MHLCRCRPVIQVLFDMYAWILHLIARHEMHKSDWKHMCFVLDAFAQHVPI